MNGSASLPRAGRHPALGPGLIGLLALVTALDAMSIDMYLPAMPAMAQVLGATPAQVQQTLSVFLAGLALGQALYGPLLDRYGRRLPLLAGLVVFIAGSVLAALASSVEGLVAARFLQALGAAAGLVTPRAIVADLCTVDESARVFSLLMQVMMLAPILAPLLGGWLLGHGGWSFIFWTLAGLGVLALLGAAKAIPDTLAPAHRQPLRPGAVARAYARQARQPAFMAYTLAGGLVLGSLFSYIGGSAFVFTRGFGLTPSGFSLLFAANSIALVSGAAIGQWLQGRGIRLSALMLSGLALHAAAGLLLLMADGAGQASLWAYAGLLGAGIGTLGLVFGPLTALAMSHAGQGAGVASALMGTLQYLLSAVIALLAGLLAPRTGLPLSMAACGLAAIALCLWARRLVTSSNLP